MEIQQNIHMDELYNEYKRTLLEEKITIRQIAICDDNISELKDTKKIIECFLKAEQKEVEILEFSSGENLVRACEKKDSANSDIYGY